MNKVHCSVSGLQNSTSKTSLKNALGKLDGVQMINVDLGRGSIEVGYNEATSENEIKHCIESTGFSIQ
ncbi:heavy metal-associated domain-containing protein [Cellulosilyticum sp. ST5]|uniref:heavy-metal-associated domain-containing protein n=1 Tax=Cellulosilyticum sp. WCF-2 TaxID=2497860 RepID=UPI000F8D4917|nr:heavy metal-associated domain-containing protein [Cellulosilyticum sp. WCF-2]QEH68172.1 heavy-metal-associated domain-containing protein [Cellulosilyticum sp. WCF-2]